MVSRPKKREGPRLTIYTLVNRTDRVEEEDGRSLTRRDPLELKTTRRTPSQTDRTPPTRTGKFVAVNNPRPLSLLIRIKPRVSVWISVREVGLKITMISL